MASAARDALAAWLRGRAAVASQVVAIEDALLAGRFSRYAARRLFAFALARGWATVLHVVELTWLIHVFSFKPFVASLALQNASLVAEALFWGALEPMRRRARALGQSSESAALVSRWMTVAFWSALAVVLVPPVRAAWIWQTVRHPPTMLDVYAFVCAVRLGTDVVLRTYYSGVFAFRRVHRPVWSVFVGPTIIAAVTLALWSSLAGWSFVVALLASVVVTRALLFSFTRRAYRWHRIPAPRFRLGLRRRDAHADWRGRAEIAVAAFANTATRLGSVVLLAAVIPSLSPVPGDDGEPTVEPFALALHVAAPLLLLSSQWGLSFYHDWKRLEGDESEILARHLHRRTIVTAILVALVAWALTVIIVRAYVPTTEVETALASLLVGMIGLSVWSAINLRGFARGEFARQLAASLAMIAVLWGALSASVVGEPAWYLALGAGPWAAIVLHELLGLRRWRHATGLVTTHGAWTRALRASAGTTTIWEAKTARAPARIAERIAEKLGERGAVVRLGPRLLWFERSSTGEGLGRLEWLAAGGGELVDLHTIAVADASSPPNGDLRKERAAFMRAFPEGFVVEIGRRPPPAFLALSPAVRQEIWREAVRSARARRGRTPWRVRAWSPTGGLEAFFVAPRGAVNSRTDAKADIFDA